jgi:AraC-like DNA-binding protein
LTTREASDARSSLLAPTIANVFQILDVGLTLWEPPRRWREIYERSASVDVLAFETQHGRETERTSYNSRCLDRAWSSRTTVVAEHSGFTDLFVPVCFRGRSRAVLAAGPFSTARPTSAEMTAHWRTLTGRQADPKDPEFSKYLSVALGTLVLAGERTTAFRRLVERVAALIAGDGAPDDLIVEIENLGKGLSAARLVERMWALSADLVDERTERIWASPTMRPRRRALGIQLIPDSALVGLFVNRDADSDPVSESLRRDGFQRACVELAHKSGHACGRIGDSGFTLLAARPGSEDRSLSYLLDVGEKLGRLGRRYGLTVHLGACATSASVSDQYRAALGAAESALAKGVRAVRAADTLPVVPLGPLQRELGALVEHQPDALPARFERYLEAIAGRSGHRLDLARAYVEAGFERVLEALQEASLLDAKSFDGFSADVVHRSSEASSIADLFGIYRRAVDSIVEAVAHPALAKRDYGLRRTEEYIRTHYAKPLALKDVARIAGFTDKYFSEVFHKKQGTTFERYLVEVRLERARQLLASTAGPARPTLQRIAQLSGFSTSNYLCRVFKKHTGETPLAYRRRALP